MSSGSRGGGERESSRKIPEKKRGLNKNARSGANADPKLGVRWQFGGGGGGAASDDMFIPEPSSKYMRHGVWRHPFLRKTLKGLRLSRFGACLAVVAGMHATCRSHIGCCKNEDFNGSRGVTCLYAI